MMNSGQSHVFNFSTIRQGGKTFIAPNEVEFQKLYEEIFKKHVYYVHLDEPSPFIIDAGAHVGLASIYYKSLFPRAKILSFEPLPLLVQCFRQNLLFHDIEDIEIVPLAISDREGQIVLFHDAEPVNYWPSTTSIFPGAWDLRQKTKPIPLSSTKLSQYIDRPVDILKIDIEGLEMKVLQEIRPKLKFVKHLLIEFHANHFNHPDRIIQLLEDEGYEIEVTEDKKQIAPRQMQWRIPKLYFIEAHRKG